MSSIDPSEDAKRAGASFALNTEGVTSTSRGLVGDTIFAILPNVKPIHTFAITLAFQSVSLLSRDNEIGRIFNFTPQIFMFKLWKTPTYKSFLCALTLCGYVSYMFGWHVHEKAILLVLVPLRCVQHSLVTFLAQNFSLYSLLASESHALFRTYVLASVAGVFSLFPLLFTPAGERVIVAESILENLKHVSDIRRNSCENCVLYFMDVSDIPAP